MNEDDLILGGAFSSTNKILEYFISEIKKGDVKLVFIAPMHGNYIKISMSSNLSLEFMIPSTKIEQKFRANVTQKYKTSMSQRTNVL